MIAEQATEATISPETAPPKVKSLGGRPSKLTPEIAAQIATDLENFLHINQACERAKISTVTFYEWRKQGAKKNPKPDMLAFREATDTASANAEAGALLQIKQGVFNWQARAWLLERRWPDRWAKRIDRSSFEDMPAAVAASFVVNFADAPKRLEDEESGG